MNFDNFTIKAQQALQQAIDRAQQNGQQAITPVHLLAGVLAVGENVTQFVFGKMGVNEHALQAAVNSELQRQPRVSGGGSPYLDQEANDVAIYTERIICVPKRKTVSSRRKGEVRKLFSRSTGGRKELEKE